MASKQRTWRKSLKVRMRSEKTGMGNKLLKSEMVSVLFSDPLQFSDIENQLKKLELEVVRAELLRKQTEEATELQQSLFQTLIDSIPDRIFAKDRECRFLLCNIAQLEAMNVHSNVEVIGKSDHDFRPADLADHYNASDRKVMEADCPLIDFEAPTILPSGEPGTLLVSKVPFHNSTGDVIGLIGISRDITVRKRLEQELRLYATKLEETVEHRTQQLFAANEELTAINEEMLAMNESLQAANRELMLEISIRQQKDQELLLREKQYRATTGLLTHSSEDFDALLANILQDAMQLVGATGGTIGLQKENSKDYVVHHSFGNSPELQIHRRLTDRGMLGEVFRSGEVLCVEDYRRYPNRLEDANLSNSTTVIMVPLKLDGEVTGTLTACWFDEIHQVPDEDLELLRQFGVLASIALEKARAKQKITYQKELLQKLAETTTALVNELDSEKVLQNILEHATSFTGITDGFIQLFEPNRLQACFKCGVGRYECMVGTRMRFEGKGLFAEILRTGKPVFVEDYENWPQRIHHPVAEDATFVLQAPLNIGGKTVGSIGLSVFGEPGAIDKEKLAVLEQYATVASIAIKNAQAYQQTSHQAFHDSLTGLPNRAYLTKRLEEEVQKARQGEAGGAVLFLDLDDLKTVNDSYGHSCGDAVIKASAKQISWSVGPDAFVARVGGDEFIVILPGEDNLKNIAQIANRLVTASHREYEVEGRNIHMSASLGVTLYPGDGDKAEEILKNADNAMYAAKTAGRNCWRFYEPGMLKDAYEKMIFTNSLRHALERGELYLHYQPQIEIGSGGVVGFEALLRWNSLEHGQIPPVRFIPLAEQSGLILPIGEWVIREACRFARKLADMGKASVHVAVNVSPRQLVTEGFVGIVRQCIEKAGIRAEQLEVEITENVMIDSLEESTRILGELSSLGVRLTLDDFGTGYSSLTYLQNLPVGTLKIDKSFTDKMLQDKVQEDFIRLIIELSHSFGLRVIAEGVETKEQLQKLSQFGCDNVQGYVFSKPVSEEEAIRFSNWI